MFNDVSRVRVAGAWVVAVTVIAACSVLWGINLTVSGGELWLAAGLVPPGVMLLLWPTTRPMAVSQILHSVKGPAKGGRS